MSDLTPETALAMAGWFSGGPDRVSPTRVDVLRDWERHPDQQARTRLKAERAGAALSLLGFEVRRKAEPARIDALHAELKRQLHSHNGLHVEDCEAYAASDEDEPACSCGALAGRNAGRAVLDGGATFLLAERVGAVPEWAPEIRSALAAVDAARKGE